MGFKFAGKITSVGGRNERLKPGQKAQVIVTAAMMTEQKGLACVDGVVFRDAGGDSPATVGAKVNVLLEDVNRLTQGTNYGASRVYEFLRQTLPDGDKLSPSETSERWESFMQGPKGYVLTLRAYEQVDKNDPSKRYIKYEYIASSSNSPAEISGAAKEADRLLGV